MGWMATLAEPTDERGRQECVTCVRDRMQGGIAGSTRGSHGIDPRSQAGGPPNANPDP